VFRRPAPEHMLRCRAEAAAADCSCCPVAPGSARTCAPSSTSSPLQYRSTPVCSGSTWLPTCRPVCAAGPLRAALLASRQQAAGSRQQAAGGRRQAAGGRRQAAGSRRQAAGKRQGRGRAGIKVPLQSCAPARWAGGSSCWSP
jgi:hypothetical protein